MIPQETNYQRVPTNQPQQPIQQQPEDPLTAKMRKWVFIGLVAIVSGVAVIAIIISLIGKFF